MFGRVLRSEEWRPVAGYEGLYQVSSGGVVRSLRYDPPKAISVGKDRDGYPIVRLYRDGKRTTIALHRVVCRAFHGEPNILHNEAAHLDGDRTNARADNLKWASKCENHFHRKAHGTSPAGANHPRAKLTEENARKIRHSNAPRVTLAKRFGVSWQTVNDIQRGRRWRHL